jgi:hypothetical protein
MTLAVHRLPVTEINWSQIDSFNDRNVFQTREWIEFIASTLGAEPVICALKDGNATVGYFTGLITRRYGIPILGSPMRGWSTWYMGFNLLEGVPRSEALRALVPYAFNSLDCWHVEVGDRNLSLDDVRGLGVPYTQLRRVEVDLRREEDEIWAGMTSACRRCIRKAEKSGVTIEEASDLEFADDYFAQLRDVFARQSMVPPYDAGRVRALIRTLHPSGRLLLVRARDLDGNSIATGIFPAMNRSMYFWGGASWSQYQHLRPNEPIMWYALRYWKARGVEACDLGGVVGFDYKRKYGTQEVTIPLAHQSKYRALWAMRNAARRASHRRQKILGRIGKVSLR